MTTISRKLLQGHDPTQATRDRELIGHDVRVALQGVLGGVAMVDASTLSEPARAQFERVAAASKSLARLLNAFLSDGQPDERHDARTDVDLSRLLRDVAHRWTAEALASGHRFRVSTSVDRPTALAVDLVSLERSLANVIGNALRHTAGGDVTLFVRRGEENDLVFSIRDSGEGLPPWASADGPASFALRPLVQGERHGLGIQIVRNLCSEMGADLSVANLPAGGAEVSLRFPASLVSNRAPRAEKRFDFDGMRVLLAEDNPINQIVATEMLRALNADVTLAADGVEALERFEAGRFDLVVVDIEMPRLNGLEVIRAIRNRRDQRAGVPIVALTAYALREHRDRVAAAGANGLIPKPITSVDALGEALARHLPGMGEIRPEDVASDVVAPFDKPEAPVADLAIFDALSDAIGADMMDELLEKVVTDLSQARDNLAAALAPLDPRPIQATSHILISVAGAIGAVRLQACARSLNVAANGAKLDDLPAGVAHCLDEIDAAIGFAQSRSGTAEARP